MAIDSIEHWARRLDDTARLTLGDAMVNIPCNTDEFRDERGNRRSVDPPLLAWIWGRRALPADSIGEADADVRLWWSLHAGTFDDGAIVPGGGSPLVKHGEMTGIEVWTERELSAMHALWNAGRKFGRDDLARRAIGAALWHVEHMQPDNATNRAWGVHVFVMAAARTGTIEADLYAQTLVHNCTVGLGRPDVLSAWLLVDAARELRAVVQTPIARGREA